MVDLSNKELAYKFQQLKDQNPGDFAEVRLLAAVDETTNVGQELLVKLGFDFVVMKTNDPATFVEAALSEQRMEQVPELTSVSH